jgi:hypothetical protein
MKLLASLVVVAAVALTPLTADAVVIGQIDTFEDGTTAGWGAGFAFGAVPPFPPQNVPDGGPTGAGDAFLQITAVGGTGIGFEPGSRLSAINATQWAGDYLATGVTSISMDLRNLGASDLTIRLLFEDPMGAPPLNEAVTTFGALLPAGGDWTHVVFPISPADLTVLFGDATTLLSQVTFLRIIHNPTPNRAVPVIGVLGVDNITAGPLAVPEPSSLALVASAAGLAGLAVIRRRRRNGSRGERGQG